MATLLTAGPTAAQQDWQARASYERHRLELFHGTPTGWEGSLGYRLMSLAPEDIHIFHAAVARYLPGRYLRTLASVNPSFEEKDSSREPPSGASYPTTA